MSFLDKIGDGFDNLGTLGGLFFGYITISFIVLIILNDVGAGLWGALGGLYFTWGLINNKGITIGCLSVLAYIILFVLIANMLITAIILRSFLIGIIGGAIPAIMICLFNRND